jgi:hypothetical protein
LLTGVEVGGFHCNLILEVLAAEFSLQVVLVPGVLEGGHIGEGVVGEVVGVVGSSSTFNVGLPCQTEGVAKVLKIITIKIKIHL